MLRILLPAAAGIACALYIIFGAAPPPPAPLAETQPERLRATFAYQAMKWYNNQRAYPTGNIPHAWREKAAADLERHGALEKSSSANTLAWTSLGPTNVGGRKRSLVINPTNPNIMYCGSVSGGIFKTVDGGATWFPLTDNAENLVIGCMVLDPSNPNIIYAGTGEGYFNIDYLRGDGVLKSTDGGSTWTLLKNFIGANSPYYYHFINKLVIRPDNPSILFAATLGGIWKTTNGGTSWTKLPPASVKNKSTACMDLVINPLNANIMYASFGLFSPDGICKTTDGGITWSRLAGGFPTAGAGFARISLGISASNPQVLYASLADSINFYTHSIQKTTDGGISWTQVATPTDAAPQVNSSHLGGQGWYNNVIAVHPGNPDIVFAGGINNFKSTNGGTSWSRISNGYGFPYVHVDQHIIVFHPTNPSTMYFGNDGGIFRSMDGGLSFTELNNQLVTAQFYSGAVHPSLPIYFGGTQDNGTLKLATGTSWEEVNGGDGGPTMVDPVTPTTVYSSYVWLKLYRSTNSGQGFSLIMSGIPTTSDGWASDRTSFIAPFVMDPSNPNILAGGTYRVYRTTNRGSAWTAISLDLTGDGAGTTSSAGSVITALAFAKTPASALIYAGTSGSATKTALVLVGSPPASGTLWNWTNVTRTNLPDRYVTSFAIDPADGNRAYACFSGYAETASPPYKHVFLTTNKGASWIDVSGNLPDVPVNTIVMDPVNASHLVIGTDIGVFESTAGGTVWVRRNDGMANVAVTDLDVRPSDNRIIAATHGRGMFISDFAVGVDDETPPALPSAFALEQNYPNPFNPLTHLRFTIFDLSRSSRGAERDFASLSNSQWVTLKVYNVLGEEVATLVNEEKMPGTYAVSWDATGMPSGIYYSRLEAGGFREIRKMVLVK